jgi:VanZ family protein
MRIRKPFAGAFLALCLISGFAGFTPQQYQLPTYKQSDKVLHFIAFFGVTVAFYWILETSRRKVVQLTITICTIGLAVASEIVQGLLPNGRQFDLYDVLANMLGSATAVVLCNWYHKRMLERKRAARGYAAVAGDELDDRGIELGEDGGQQEGIVRPSGPVDVDEELANWDEHAEDWEDTELPDENTNGQRGSIDSTGDIGVADTKKRHD